MGKIYVRFSTPGGKGYIPGTSTDKFRTDWILTESITTADSGDPKNPVRSLSFPHLHDKTSERFQNFAVNEVPIDKVVAEMVNDDGSIFLRVTLEHARIDSFNQRRKNHELIEMGALKSYIEQLVHSPADMKRAGLDPTFGMRGATRIA